MGDRGLLRPVAPGGGGGGGPSSLRVYNEKLQGIVNGVNKVFITASPFANIVLYLNGVRLENNEFSVSGASEVTLVEAPRSEIAPDVVSGDYDIA